MRTYIQHALDDGTWSSWSLGCFKQNQWFVSEQPLMASVVRAIKDKKPLLVCWYALHDGFWYEIAPSKTGYIAKARPLSTPASPLAIEKVVGDFSTTAFNQMLDSAKDYLAPPLFTVEDMASRLIRPADTRQVMALTAATTAAEAMNEWWGDLYRQYYEDIRGQLMAIVDRPLTRAQQIAALVDFFKSHYAFIQGSCLDYLAIPEHPVSLMLISVAEVLAKATNLPVINILMPGLAINNHVNGDCLTDLSLKQVLQTHLYLTSGFLMPASLLNQYLDDPLSPLYCPYGHYNKESKLWEYPRLSAQDIDALFNHSAETLALKDAFQSIEILRNQTDHLLGQLYLLIKRLKLYNAHGGLGTAENAAGGAYPAIMSFMQYYLSLEPCQLLIQDRPPTLEDVPVEQKLAYVYYQEQLYFINGYQQTITALTMPDQKAKSPVFLARFSSLHDIPQHLDTPCIVQTDDGQYTLFPQQTVLNQEAIDEIALNFPNEKQRVIQLAASNFTTHVFQALLDAGFTTPGLVDVFADRFKESQALSQEDLAWISTQTGHSFLTGYTLVPASIRIELELLWQLFHNPTKNQNATTNLATCIGTRAYMLQEEVVQYENQLIAISIHPQQQQKLLTKAQSQLYCLREHFNQALQAQTYQGQDRHLTLSTVVMKRYGKIIIIRAIQDLYTLSLFNPSALQSLLDQQQIVIHFEQELAEAEDFILYLSQTPAAILKIVLPYVFKIFAFDNIFWPITLELIGIEKERIIFGIWSGTLRALGDFLHLFRSLRPDQRSRFFEEMKGHWLEIIKSGTDFSTVLEHLTPEEKGAMYELMNGRWFEIIKNGTDFSAVLAHLTPEQQSAVYESINGCWLEIIRNEMDLIDVMNHLTEEQRRAVSLTMKNCWRGRIKNGEGFAAFYAYLDEEQKEAVYQSLTQDEWCQMIDSGEDLASVLSVLTREQSSALCEAIKDHLLAKVSTTDTLIGFLQLLPAGRWSIAYAVIQSAVPDIIIDSGDIRAVLQWFNPTQCELICRSIEKHWSSIIKDNSALIDLLCWVKFENFDTVCASIEQAFPAIVKDCDQLNMLLWHLHADRCIKLCQIMKVHWPHFIHNGRDFVTVCQDLAGKIVIVFASMQEHLLTILKTAKDCDYVFDYLPKVQSSILFDAMKGRWATMIKTQEDLRVLERLNPAQCKTVCDEIKGNWSTVFKKPNKPNGFFLSPDAYEQSKAMQNALVSDKLLQYKTRIESQMSNGAPDFEYGFWFFKKSRAVNRKINYLIAVQLLTELQLQSEYFNLAMFGRINEIRENILTALSAEDKKNYVDRGINSHELKEIIQLAKSF